MLNGIDRIVQGQNISIGGNLCMQRDQCSAGSVVMYDEIVDPGDIIIGEYDIIDLLHKLRFRGLSQQRTDGILRSHEAGVEDEHTHQHTTVAIDNDAGGGGDDGANENHRGCHHIA